MASRLIYGMAQQGIVPRPLGRVHRERRTPWVAIIFTTALAMVLVVIGDLTTLANTTVLLLLAVFVCVNIAVLVLRGQPVEHRHFHAPTLLPILGVGCCIALIIDKLADDATTFAYASGLLALGVVLWLVAQAVTGPVREIEPEKLVD
jgi:basic amino acid/polyamine antiporter, APA family